MDHSAAISDAGLAEILAHPDISAPLSRRNLSSEDLTKVRRMPDKFLVNISIVDSPGPVKFIVDSTTPVEHVIKQALQEYEYEGRLPALGTDPAHFQLYSAHDISEALNEKTHIGDAGVRDFIVHKRPDSEVAAQLEEDHPTSWHTRLLHTVAAHFNRDLATASR